MTKARLQRIRQLEKKVAEMADDLNTLSEVSAYRRNNGDHVLVIRFPGGRTCDRFDAVFDADFTRKDTANMLEAVSRHIRQERSAVRERPSGPALFKLPKPRLCFEEDVWYCIGRLVWGSGPTPKDAYTEWAREFLKKGKR